MLRPEGCQNHRRKCSFTTLKLARESSGGSSGAQIGAQTEEHKGDGKDQALSADWRDQALSADWREELKKKHEQALREAAKYKAVALQLLDENDELHDINSQIASEVERQAERSQERYSTIEINNIQTDPNIEKEIELALRKQAELEQEQILVIEKAEEAIKKTQAHERLYARRKKASAEVIEKHDQIKNKKKL